MFKGQLSSQETHPFNQVLSENIDNTSYLNNLQIKQSKPIIDLRQWDINEGQQQRGTNQLSLNHININGKSYLGAASSQNVEQQKLKTMIQNNTSDQQFQLDNQFNLMKSLQVIGQNQKQIP